MVLQSTTSHISRKTSANENAKIADHSQRVVKRKITTEQLCEQMTDMKHEHARIVNEQAQELRKPAGSDNVAKEQIREAMARVEAEVDVTVGTSGSK